MEGANGAPTSLNHGNILVYAYGPPFLMHRVRQAFMYASKNYMSTNTARYLLYYYYEAQKYIKSEQNPGRSFRQRVESKCGVIIFSVLFRFPVLFSFFFYYCYYYY